MILQYNQKNYSPWKNIFNVPQKDSWRGTAFRFPLQETCNAWIDVMLVIEPHSPSMFSLVITSGENSGKTLLHLPREAQENPDVYGISIPWLIKNWKEKIYPIDPKHVFFNEEYAIDPNWHLQTYPKNTRAEWEKLTLITSEAIKLGAVFRSPARYPYEDWVDFMLIESKESPSGYIPLVASGYKAGHRKSDLPLEAKSQDGNGISTHWLIENWQDWVYEKGPGRVFYRERFTVNPNWQLTDIYR